MAEIVKQTAGAAAGAPENAKRGFHLPKRRKKAGGAARRGHAGKSRKRLIILLAAFVLLAAIATFVFLALRLDFLGARSVFIGAVDSLDPDYVALAERTRYEDARSAELDAREAQLREESDRLDSRGAELDSAKAAFDAERSAAAERQDEVGYWLGLSPQETEDIKSLGRTYAAMDAAAAAEIMARLYTVNDMAAILYHMAEKRVAPILEAMDRQLAAQITEVLLGN